MIVEIRGDFGEAIALGVAAGDDVVADLPDLAVVVGEQSGFDFFVFQIAVFVGVGVDERDLFADVFVEEFCGIEEIVFVILFEDVEFGGVGERAEVDGGGIDGGGDVFEFEAEVAGGESEISDVADEGDVGVVDGDVEVGLVGEGGGGAFCLGGVVLWAGVRGGVGGEYGGGDGQRGGCDG